MNPATRLLPPLVVLTSLVLAAAGCAPPPQGGARSSDSAPDLYAAETPPADADWRPHLLSTCDDPAPPPAAALQALAACFELRGFGESGDGIMELEMYLDGHGDEGLVLLTLAQLYVLAAQGDPDCLPTGGPAADVGDWPRNQRRLAARASEMLDRAALLRPDDAVVEYLRADLARVAGRQEDAAAAEFHGYGKCSFRSSWDMLRRYQGLGLRAVRMLESVSPGFPESALRAGISGEVVTDLLITPAGEVARVVTVSSPDPSLARAAAEALRRGSFEAARVGKYPVWAWLRIPVRFTLSDAPGE